MKRFDYPVPPRSLVGFVGKSMLVYTLDVKGRRLCRIYFPKVKMQSADDRVVSVPFNAKIRSH